MSEYAIDKLEQLRPISKIDEFLVVERIFSADASNPSIGLANIHAVVPNVEANRSKILRATQIFKERRTNIAVFPELCFSGYFWEDEKACREYMDSAVLEEQYDWIEAALVPLLDDCLREIILNGVARGPDNHYYNTTILVARDNDYRNPENAYRKVFLPGIEKLYTATGQTNRLVMECVFGRYGFTTCYDYLFHELLREYAFEDEVDAIIQVASWRAVATRDYPTMNVRTDQYYGHLWDMVKPASSATHQFWTIACNAVGQHAISGATFWGGSGIWAPSGLKLVQASNIHEELLIVHNLGIKNQRQLEADDFDFAFDFREMYRPMKGRSTVSRIE
jgi:predicted amidohydrolase